MFYHVSIHFLFDHFKLFITLLSFLIQRKPSKCDIHGCGKGFGSKRPPTTPNNSSLVYNLLLPVTPWTYYVYNLRHHGYPIHVHSICIHLILSLMIPRIPFMNVACVAYICRGARSTMKLRTHTDYATFMLKVKIRPSWFITTLVNHMIFCIVLFRRRNGIWIAASKYW